MPNQVADQERIKKILAWRVEGKTLWWIGEQLSITPERVRQIIVRHKRNIILGK